MHTLADDGSVATVGAGVNAERVAIDTLIQRLVLGAAPQVSDEHSARPLPKHVGAGSNVTDVASEVEHSSGRQKKVLLHVAKLEGGEGGHATHPQCTYH